MDSPGVINAYTISLAKVGAFFAIQKAGAGKEVDDE
jgi:hypothetical protein